MTPPGTPPGPSNSTPPGQPFPGSRTGYPQDPQIDPPGRGLGGVPGGGSLGWVWGGGDGVG
jgi:hypothetical protein